MLSTWRQSDVCRSGYSGKTTTIQRRANFKRIAFALDQNYPLNVFHNARTDASALDRAPFALFT